MTQDMWNIVNVCRANGVSVTDEEAISIYEYCLRKMDIAKVANQEEYFLFLFADELKDYLVRRATNAISMTIRIAQNGI